jgi:hypothetical protein
MAGMKISRPFKIVLGLFATLLLVLAASSYSC